MYESEFFDVNSGGELFLSPALRVELDFYTSYQSNQQASDGEIDESSGDQREKGFVRDRLILMEAERSIPNRDAESSTPSG